MKKSLIYIFCIALCAGVGYIIGRKGKDNPLPEIVTRCDTLIVYDTTHIDHFHIIKETVVDTMLIVKTEVVTENDTEYIQLPRTTVTVQDSLFTAQISGFEPQLDWIDINTTSKVITLETVRYEPQKRWSFGVTVGPSALITPKGNIYGGLGVTAGVQFRF